jgi:hypothetical protein
MVSFGSMSDLLAGLIGVVVGALCTAGTTVYMARRRETRDARAARRVILSEPKEAAKAVNDGLEHEKWPEGWTKRIWSESWSMYRPTLALAIRDDDQFDKIATAYLYMSLLQPGLAEAANRDLSTNDRKFLTEVSKALSDAMPPVSETSSDPH